MIYFIVIQEGPMDLRTDSPYAEFNRGGLYAHVEYLGTTYLSRI